ncbi:DUF6083 domain-containing protein [Streptomyces sp. NPDC000151]|uniref:DUF6083 domain-containing protein n=1 Tax=Streptomyces sp. NPDC000151 TaxID=3154244 RepID=UPI00333141E2
MQDRALAPSRGDPGPDEHTWHEPPPCPDCGAVGSVRRTNYDRWVRLAAKDLPAKDVPPEHRWRLETVRTRHSSYGVGLVAMRLGAIEPLPSDLVCPAHRTVCLCPEAEEERQRWYRGG